MVLSSFLLLASLALPLQDAAEAFDGSFRLETGEVITGGYFVEGGQGRFLYMDTAGLDKGGLFERVGNATLRSLIPPGIVEIVFIADADGAYNTLEWRERGRKPIRGARVHPHRSSAIQFTSADGTALKGRLLVPTCAGPHPVVVSVHGSGPINRYGGPYHTFFLQHGIAVLSYDKRGYTTDREAWREPDLAVLSADAAAAVRFAATRDALDRDRIGLVGSSQAGWVVPRAALEAPETDFMILRAGAGLRNLDTVLHEIRQELRSDGLSGLELDYAMDLRREAYMLAMNGAPLSATDALVAPYLDEPWYKAAFGEGPISGRWSSRRWDWMRRNLATAPAADIARFDGPVLWFLAGRDENVPLVSTRAALARAFAASPGDDHEIVVLDDALHSFLVRRDEGPPRFAEGFFDHMATWLNARGLSAPACGTSSRR